MTGPERRHPRDATEEPMIRLDHVSKRYADGTVAVHDLSLSVANSVVAVELVTADGRHVRSDRDNEPDLFWAVRGGGGSFGIVTAMA